MKKIVLIIIILGLLFGLWRWYHKHVVPNSPAVSNSKNLSSASPTLSPTQTIPPTSNSLYTEPVAEFKKRITKKSFGTFITPQNSPVQPEKFSGYHAGVDVEYEDVTGDVPVLAIADGELISLQTASGYGGVMVEKFQNNGQTLYAIYGHIRLSNAKKPGSVKKGDQVAILGTGHSAETDGERKHLHFGIAKSNTILGYVQSKSALNSTFIDPLSLYP